MDNYDQDNGSLFDELLYDHNESFLFGGSDLWRGEAPTGWQETSFNNNIEESDYDYI